MYYYTNRAILVHLSGVFVYDIHQMISFFFFFNLSRLPHISGMIKQSRKIVSLKRQVPCTHKAIYLYRFRYQVQQLLLPEWIDVTIEQLHDGSILGLQTPFLSSELYNCMPLDKKELLSTGWRGLTHVTHTVRPDTSKPHLALGLGAFHPE